MQFFAKTDLGKRRQVNQDYYIAKNEQLGIFPNLFIVADGVGSNRLSDYASKHCSLFVVDQLKATTNNGEYIKEFLKTFNLVNIDLYNRIVTNEDFMGMGTTMVMGTIVKNKLIVGNVGDSRCYHIKKRMVQVTHDHSLAEELANAKEIKRYSKEYYEIKNQLTRAIGATIKINPDFFELELDVGDYILFCSDGLSNMLNEAEMMAIIKNKNINIDEKVKMLIDKANEKGGYDNIAVILIYMDKIDDNIKGIEENIISKPASLEKDLNEELLKDLKNRQKENLYNKNDSLNDEINTFDELDEKRLTDEDR